MKGARNIYTKIRMPLQSVLLMKNWPEYNAELISSKLGMMKGKGDVTTYHFRSGIKASLLKKTVDRSTLNEIWFWKTYNPKGFEIRKNDTVVDIGAHKGFFTLYALQSSPSRILSFEPNPDNFEWLRRNVSLNARARPDTKITLRKYAVHSRPCKTRMYLSNSNRTHSIIKPGNSGRRTIKVSCTTLRHIKKTAGHIDFLKIDVEGSEYDIIFSDDLRDIDRIAMEFSNISRTKNQSAMVQYLRSKGFVTRVKKPMIYAKRR